MRLANAAGVQSGSGRDAGWMEKARPGRACPASGEGRTQAGAVDDACTDGAWSTPALMASGAPGRPCCRELPARNRSFERIVLTGWCWRRSVYLRLRQPVWPLLRPTPSADSVSTSRSRRRTARSAQNIQFRLARRRVALGSRQMRAFSARSRWILMQDDRLPGGRARGRVLEVVPFIWSCLVADGALR